MSEQAVPTSVACAPYSTEVNPRATPEQDKVVVLHLNQASPCRLVKDAPNWFRDLKTTPEVGAEDYQWALRAWGALYCSLWRTSGFRKHGVYDAPCQSFVEQYAKRLRDGYKAIKYLKYHTVYAFAYGTNQEELPACPYDNSTDRPGIWSGGWIYRTLSKLYLKARANHETSIKSCYDILNSKTGFPPVPKGFIDQAVKDHRASLTKPHVRDESLRARLDRSLTRDGLKRIIGRLFRRTKLTLDEVIVPSLSACYQRPVGEGGALEYVIREFLGSVQLTEDDFKGAAYCYTYDPKLGFVQHVLPEFSKIINRLKEWLMDENLDRLTEPCTAVPHAIPEPLKCRIITKGHAIKYLLAMHLQRLLWRTVSECAIFQYTAHPIDPVDFSRVFRKLASNEVYVSGDYKASTDNIDPEMTRFVWQCVSDVVNISGVPLRDTMFFDIGLQCLTDHLLEYKVENKVVREQQAWGQLMGSPMSFPILNLINYAATCVALKLDPLHFDTNPIRTNGDDIGFICREDQYDAWVRVLKNVGLERSAGKNYRSKKFLIINSELRFFSEHVDKPENEVIVFWQYEEPRKKVHEPVTNWELHGFLNQSLLFGVSKKGQEAGQRMYNPWPTLGPICDALIRGHDLKDSQRLVDAFLKTREVEIATIPPYVAYSLPVDLGGAGLPWKFIRSQPSQGQLQIASTIYNNPAGRLNRPAPRVKKDKYADILKQSRAYAYEHLHLISDAEEKSLGNHLVLGSYIKETWLSLKNEGTDDQKKRPVKDHSEGFVQKAAFLFDAARMKKKYARWFELFRWTSLHPIGEYEAHNFVETWSNVSYISPPYLYEPSWADHACVW